MALGWRLRPARIRWFGLGIFVVTAALGCSNTDKLPAKATTKPFPTPRLPAPSNLDPAVKAATAPTAGPPETHATSPTNANASTDNSSTSKTPLWNAQPKPLAPQPSMMQPNDQPRPYQQTPLGAPSMPNNPAVMTPTPAGGTYGPTSSNQPIQAPIAPVAANTGSTNSGTGVSNGTNTGFLPPIGLQTPMPPSSSDNMANAIVAPINVPVPNPPVVSTPSMPNSSK